jgi:hypothetical protein
MRFFKHYKIECCTSTDPIRFILNNVCVKHAGADGAERPAHLDATDGMCLARVPCIVEPEDVVGNGMIPCAVIDMARKIKQPSLQRDLVRVRMLASTWEIVGKHYTVTFVRDADTGTYPNTDQVIPAPVDTNEIKAHHLCLDPMLLESVALAIGRGDKAARRGVVLSSVDDLSPIRVTTTDDPDVIGVVMPLRMA